MFLILHDWIISQTCFLFNARTHSRFVYFAFIFVFVVIITVCRYGCCFIAHKALTDLFTKWKHSMDTSNRKLNRFSPISCENFLIVYLSLCFFSRFLGVVFIVTACQRQCGMDVFFPLVVIATRRAIQSRSKNEIFSNSNSIVQFRKTYSRKFNYPHEKWAGRVRISLW